MIRQRGALEERNAALRTREAQLSAMIAAVPDAMVFVDGSGTIQTYSRAAERLFGQTAQQVLGRNISVLIAPDSLWSAEERSAAPTSLETGPTRTIRVKTADGRAIPVELRTAEARIAGKRASAMFFCDITERLAAEERLSTLRSELIQTSRLNALGEMAAGIAHELNQPLAAAVNFIAASDMMLRGGGGSREGQRDAPQGEQPGAACGRDHRPDARLRHRTRHGRALRTRGSDAARCSGAGDVGTRTVQGADHL